MDEVALLSYIMKTITLLGSVRALVISNFL
jgi:hypothetical protein